MNLSRLILQSVCLARVSVVSCIYSTMVIKESLDGKKMQGKLEDAMRMRSFRASKRAPLDAGLADYPYPFY